jgi:hypothetical protein
VIDEYGAMVERYFAGETEVLGENLPSATLSTTNPTWIDPGANPGFRGERPVTNNLSHGKTLLCICVCVCVCVHTHTHTHTHTHMQGLSEVQIDPGHFHHMRSLTIIKTEINERHEKLKCFMLKSF